MPVTARLSKAFYDRFGDEIVAELVEWLNLVDATYRSELRAINEINFARFEAHLERRIAELRAELRILDQKLEQKLETVATEASVDRHMAALTTVIERRLSEQVESIDRRLREQSRMMIAAWGVLMASMIALWTR